MAQQQDPTIAFAEMMDAAQNTIYQMQRMYESDSYETSDQQISLTIRPHVISAKLTYTKGDVRKTVTVQNDSRPRSERQPRPPTVKHTNVYSLMRAAGTETVRRLRAIEESEESIRETLAQLLPMIQPDDGYDPGYARMIDELMETR